MFRVAVVRMAVWNHLHVCPLFYLIFLGPFKAALFR